MDAMNYQTDPAPTRRFHSGSPIGAGFFHALMP